MLSDSCYTMVCVFLQYKLYFSLRFESVFLHQFSTICFVLFGGCFILLFSTIFPHSPLTTVISLPVIGLLSVGETKGG